MGTSGWLAVSPSSGTITINQPTNLHLTINPSAAGSGYHTAYVVLMQVCTLAFRLHPEGGHGKGTQAFALLLELNLLHLLHRARCTGLSRVWGRLGALQHCTTALRLQQCFVACLDTACKTPTLSLACCKAGHKVLQFHHEQ